MEESTEMSTRAKGLKLVVRAYLVTMGVTVLITLLTIILMVDTHSCSSVSRALTVLGATTAVVFLASVAVVGVGAWKAIPGVADRLGTVVVYGVMMLASYVVITCGLMVVFNC
jgi:hypothetical protein